MILGTGIDIIEIDRVEAAIKRWGDSFLRYIFTDDEIAYAKKHKYPTQHFAARFAAKEAVLKAIGDNSVLHWKDIQITNDKNGKPVCRYNKKSFKKKILISLSHTKNYAVASAIITD
ncbi:MAG: holo-ACP synthase [Candidatus Omnitrophota bacterium]